MGLSVYEKNNVEAGKDCVVKGNLTFNVLDKPRKQAPSSYVPDPKPEYVVAIENPQYLKGDENLIKALSETQYGEKHNQLSIHDKSPFAPTIFGGDNEKSTTDKVIPAGKCLKKSQDILIHVTTYEGYGNVGCGFDAIKVQTPLNELILQSAGGSVDSSVFDI